MLMMSSSENKKHKLITRASEQYRKPGAQILRGKKSTKIIYKVVDQ